MIPLSEAIDRLRGPALAEIEQIHRQLIFDGGTRADRFYEGRVLDGDPLAHYERKLLIELSRLPVAKSYHEIGGGIGLIPITLGIMGHSAVNIDGAPSRIVHGKNILASLAKTEPGLEDRVTMLCSRVPQIFDKIDTDGAIAFSTNMGCSADSDEFLPIFLKAVQTHYMEYFFDLCMMWGVYRTPKDWEEQLDHISAIWGREPEFLFEAAGPARYYRVKFK
jgi:hypothetical protein